MSPEHASQHGFEPSEVRGAANHPGWRHIGTRADGTLELAPPPWHVAQGSRQLADGSLEETPLALTREVVALARNGAIRPEEAHADAARLAPDGAHVRLAALQLLQQQDVVESDLFAIIPRIGLARPVYGTFERRTQRAQLFARGRITNALVFPRQQRKMVVRRSRGRPAAVLSVIVGDQAAENRARTVCSHFGCIRPVAVDRSGPDRLGQPPLELVEQLVNISVADTLSASNALRGASNVLEVPRCAQGNVTVHDAHRGRRMGMANRLWLASRRPSADRRPGSEAHLVRRRPTRVDQEYRTWPDTGSTQARLNFIESSRKGTSPQAPWRGTATGLHRGGLSCRRGRPWPRTKGPPGHRVDLNHFELIRFTVFGPPTLRRHEHSCRTTRRSSLSRARGGGCSPTLAPVSRRGPRRPSAVSVRAPAVQPARASRRCSAAARSS